METIQFDTNGDTYHWLPLTNQIDAFAQSNKTNGSARVISVGKVGFIAASSNGLYYSKDGKVWNQSNITSGSFNKLNVKNGMITIAGSSSNGLYYSTDYGKTWTQSNITSGRVDFINNFDNAFYAGISSKGIYKSADSGKTWTSVGLTNKTINDFYKQNNIAIAAALATGLWYQENGGAWTQSNITSDDMISICANGVGTYVACGVADVAGPGLLYSTTGKSWTRSNINVGSYNIVKYLNDLFLAGGGNTESTCRIYWSTNGQVWNTTNISSGYVYDFLYAGGLYWAAHSTGIYYSVDGKKWIKAEGISVEAKALACLDEKISVGTYDNGLYYGTTNDNKILQVINGEWTMAPLNNAEEIRY